MDKMEKIQKDRDFAIELSKSFHCESYLQDQVPSSEEQVIRLRSFFFERLKRDIASKLSTIEAYYNASNNLDDMEDCMYIFEYLQDVEQGLSQFLIDYKLCADEEEEEAAAE